MMAKHHSVMEKHLVTICAKQEEFDTSIQHYVYTGSSKSEKTQVEFSILLLPQNLAYYEHHYKTAKCSNSNPIIINRLSLIVVGGDDQTGQVDHDFSRYDKVSSVDFSDHMRSVAAAFHVVSQLANCEDVRFHLGDSNIELSSTDRQLWTSAAGAINNKTTFISKAVKYLKILANGITEEEKWGESETRVDEILKYAQAYFPNLQIVKIELTCPKLATRTKYARVIEEFLDVERRRESGGLLQKLAAHYTSTSIKEGVVVCKPCSAPKGQKNPGQINKESEQQSKSRESFTGSSSAGHQSHKEISAPTIIAGGTELNPLAIGSTTLPMVPPPNPFKFLQSAKKLEFELAAIQPPPTCTFPLTTTPASGAAVAATNRQNYVKIEPVDMSDEDETSEPPPKKRIPFIEISDEDDDHHEDEKTVAKHQTTHFSSPSSSSNQARQLISSSLSPSSCLSNISSAPSSSYSSPVHNPYTTPPQSSSSTASSFPPKWPASTYEDWENSSDEEQPRYSCSSALFCLSPPGPSGPTFDLKYLDNIPVDFEEIKNTINAGNGNEKKKEKQQRNNASKRQSFVEGVDYDRRSPKN